MPKFIRNVKRGLKSLINSLYVNERNISPNDVFLVSYPRSGNTWMRYLLAHLMQPETDWHVNNLNEIVSDIHQVKISKNPANQLRIMKSHEPFRAVYPKIIYLYRDGRDVSVSYFDYQVKLKGYQKEFKAFLIDMVMERCFRFGSWQDHISSWLFNDQVHQNILASSYENLYKNTEAELRRIEDFLELSWSQVELQNAIQLSTFQSHQQDVYQRQETHWARGFMGGVKGAPGKWREVFDDEMNEIFWHHAGAVAKKLGYKPE